VERQERERYKWGEIFEVRKGGKKRKEKEKCTHEVQLCSVQCKYQVAPEEYFGALDLKRPG